MVQSIAGGEGSVPSREPRPPSDWWSPSWCAATATFSLVRVTISMILRSLSVVPGSATARVQAAALVLLLSFTKFGLYVRTGRAAELENCQTVRVTCLASSQCCVSTSPHTTQSRRLLSLNHTLQDWAWSDTETSVLCTLLCLRLLLA